MNNQIKYILDIAGTGILVMVLLGIVFFWADRFCDNAILDSVTPNDYGVNISPSGLMADEQKIINERGDKYYPSAVKASVNYVMPLTLGLFTDFMEEETRFQGLSMTSVACDMMTDNVSNTIKPEIPKNSNHQRTYFDKDKGLFINCHLYDGFKGRDKWSKEINYYIGPEGISNEPTEQLGRFIKPLISEIELSPFYGIAVFYDKGLSRFFQIKITKDEKTVTKSPELDSEKYNPVQIGYHTIRKPKNNMLSNQFIWPNDSKNTNQAADEESYTTSYKHLIVVNKNGRIDLLDFETLELKSVGHLPEDVKQLHGYTIRPVFFGDAYKGLIVSTISSHLRYMETYVFDATGEKLGRKTNGLNEEKLPGGIANLLGKYIIENLQPAGFNILSYLTTHNYSGSKSQQAIFVRPNSYLASVARFLDKPFLIEILFAFIIIGPSLIIGIILGWRVSKRAKALGMSKTVIRAWTYSTIFTGITGYITFMLTRPAETMVTCKNCGQLRRVEQDTCHNCKADWQMKHLETADWRIVSY